MTAKKSEKLFGKNTHQEKGGRLFKDEPGKEIELSGGEQASIGGGWKVMVVDDEEDIHSVTRLALKGFNYSGKGIEFIDTYSAKESEKVLKDHPDVAVILLDVVMETNTAGLGLVKYIRENIGNRFVQIILRTGYPGYAPEREVIVSYDINDYKTKTELTAFKLFTLVLASLRAFRAVTELDELRKDLEIRVKERTTELEQKNLQIMEMDQMKTRFFANVSHEFRTPLTLILSPLEEILVTRDLEEKERMGMERMHRNALRLLGLINQLLDLAKLDAGSMKLELAQLDLAKTIRMITSGFVPMAEKKMIDFRLSLPEESYVDWIDRDKLEKIITNLLSNAFKFTPEKGKITCDAKLSNNGKKKSVLVLQVTDTGSGIPPEQLDKIFDRFYQVEGNYQKDGGGTGIGLSLTRELVSLMHGEIVVDSEPGNGSQFTLQLPLGRDHLKESEYTTKEAALGREPILAALLGLGDEKPCEKEETHEEGNPQVLIVDDSKDIRDHIRENLEKDFSIKEAEDGKQGLVIALEHIPDLVITDLMMPQMDGVELCEKLKTDEKTSHIPVIMLTAKASVESRVKGLETGADDYVTKPFNMQELKARIKNLVEQRKKLRERFSREVTLEPRDIAITSADERFLTRVIGIVEENMGDCDFDVGGLEDKAAISRMQLFRKLKALTDQSPSEFIRTLRLKRAAKLIEKDFGNVAEVTYEVGFNNLSYFAKCFKELYGINPSEYGRKK